jgi:NAD(P)-dependent dehydrogenase (short-subunit alcohol dehydrogenase family)
MQMKNKSRCVLVTGGSRGIGAATAKRFWQAGYDVVITSRSQKDLDLQIQSLGTDSLRILGIEADMSQQHDVDRVFALINKHFGEVNVLVNNAASLELASVIDTNADMFQSTMNNNVLSVFLCSKALIHQQLAKPTKDPKMILNIGSLGGLMFTQKFAGLSAYVASKYAVTGLTEALAEETKDLNIAVMALAPGAVDTQMLRKAAPDFKATTHPKNIAEVIFSLCDNTALYPLSGCIIPWNTNP